MNRSYVPFVMVVFLMFAILGATAQPVLADWSSDGQVRPISINVQVGNNTCWGPNVGPNVAIGTVTLKTIYCSIAYQGDWNYNTNSRIFDPFSSPWYYVVFRFVFDSSNWQNQAGGTGVTLDWQNILALASNQQSIIDECNNTFLLSNAQSGLSQPSGDNTGIVYNDPNSAYFIYEIGASPNHSNVWYPFNGSPYVNFVSTQYSYYPYLAAYGQTNKPIKGTFAQYPWPSP